MPSRAMLFSEPKVMLPNAFSRRQSLQGAPMSKKRRPVGLILIYLQHRADTAQGLQTCCAVTVAHLSVMSALTEGMDADVGLACEAPWQLFQIVACLAYLLP